jgi:hypothetical protein
MHTRSLLIKGSSIAVLFILGGMPLFKNHSLQAQSTQEVFGKNRVQYKNFEWKAITTTNFEIYYYQDGNNAAYLAARYAESDFDRIADLLGYTPYSKTKIFLYNSAADLQQSNVGVSNEELSMGGETNFIKSQVEIPFNGNQVSFKRDLSNSITQVFISEMMFGGSLKDMLQSSLLLSLPDWYMSGAAAYVSSGWSMEMDDYMRDALLNKNLKKPSVLSGEKATLVGQSIWNYIAERYGKSNISNILNLTRIIRNEETSIASTLGIPYSRFLKEWRQYYTDMATETAGSYPVPNFDFKPRKNNRKGLYFNKVVMSPDGSSIAYSENRKGIYRIMVINTETKRKKVIYKSGNRVINQRIDKNIPLLAWQNNNSLAIIAVEQASNKFFIYDTQKVRRKVKKTLDQFSEVLDFDISDDGTTVALSAAQNGQSDLFLFHIARNSTRQITKDIFDDLHPHFISGSTTDVVFSTNRQSDSLSNDKADFRSIQDNYGIYLLQSGGQNATSLQKLVGSVGNATHPVVVDERTIFYLNDEKGIRNLYRYNLDTKTGNQVTQFRQGIREFDVNFAKKSFAYHSFYDNQEFIGFIKNFNFDQKVNPSFTKRNANQEERSLQIKATDPNQTDDLSNNLSRNEGNKAPKGAQSELEPGEVDIDNYQFDSDLVKQEEKPTTTKPRTSILQGVAKASKKDNIPIRGPFPYKNRFTTNNVLSSLQINPITGWGIQFDVNMNDLLEDHIIKLGGLLNIDLSSNNFYGEYHYLKKRIDYGIRFDRKQIYITTEYLPQKYRLNQVMASASYPLSVSSRVTLAPFYTGTQFNEVISYSQASPVNVASTDYVGIRAEYVYDNTIVNGMNMIEGTRMKVQYDNYKAPGSSSESFDRVVVDLRNYKKIHRDIIFATRLSFGHSGGAARKRFLMGGMDNWLFNDREGEWPIAEPGVDKRDYFFLPFVTNLRGFSYNKLSGFNYLLFNAELRLPLVKYFYRGPIASNFLKNLQFVAFTDIGTAWNQQGPFSRQNDLNTTRRETESGPFRATVINFKNPFLSGYGLGARTLLLGYYVKFDAAWGVENYVVGPARFYLTLGYDF